MKKHLSFLVVFLTVFIVYFAVGTQFTLKPKWFSDYYNPLAQSLRSLRLDIPKPADTYDLSNFNGKWYVPSGLLPALFLIPLQTILGRFIPTFYLSVFFASLDVLVIFLLLQRLSREFLRLPNSWLPYLAAILYAFGTTHFYVGTLGSSWHVQQILSVFFGNLGIFLIFKKKRRLLDYFWSVFAISIAFIGRPTVVVLILLPLTLYLQDIFVKRKRRNLKLSGVVFAPLVFFAAIFMLYNYLRFDNPFEYGYSYIYEAPSLRTRRELNGASSLKNARENIWYMLFEIPSVTYKNKVDLNLNLKGNSILFLTPPFLTIFLASPIVRKKGRFAFNIYILSLWLTAVLTIIPSLLHYSTGWMQFGYRYSLDITAILVLLSLFGVKGKLNLLYILGIIFAIYIHWLGINLLM